MHATLCINDVADLSDAERERHIFERLLHLPATELAQIPVVVVRGTVRVFARELAKRFRARPDLRLVPPQDRDGLLL
jgi:hypothetical protein